MARRKTLKEFINGAIDIHGDICDYSLVDYKNDKTKVIIICNEHKHEYQIRPNDHLNGQKGCIKCKSEALSKLNKWENREFIDKCVKIHGDRYDYSLIEYNGTDIHVDIICDIHGIFSQTPHRHTGNQKQGCPKCGKISMKLIRRKDVNEFINQSNIIHNYKYDYIKYKYVNDKTKLIITCPLHGDFKMKPNQHLQRGGCSKCNTSIGEERILYILDSMNINYKYQFRFGDCKYKNELSFDFYLPELNICIEYDGQQHFSPVDFFGGEKAFIENKKRDKIKNEYCKKNNIELIRIPYFDYDNINSILLEFIPI